MTSAVDLLLPQPIRAETTGEALPLRSAPRLRITGRSEGTSAACDRARSAFEAARLSTASDAADGTPVLSLDLNRELELAESAYRLTVGIDGIRVVASSASGLFYGVTTLAQWLRIHDPGPDVVIAELPGLVVEDAPGFAHRGVLLDVSRNKVPRMETLFELVDLLSNVKINQLQLYTEHTFAYAGHERVWESADAITPEEIRALDAHCRSRCIELVPNQQSFGHFHRWLVHDSYRRLAECPDGLEHPFSTEPEPFSLCPTDPAVLELLTDLYAQLLPNFSSRLFNVGLDETLDLGRGRSADECARRGKHEVYLDFLRSVHEIAARHDRRIQFWSDIILERPGSLRRVPRDAIALDWGYEADHPFEDETRKLAESGREFYVCPGTSSWNSFAGRAQNALQNLAAAARWGRAHGASGFLITDWGDNGHLQPMTSSYLGFLAGATFAWNPAAVENPPTRWHRLLDLHAFSAPGASLGQATMALANVYLATGTPSRNGTSLFHLVMSPLDPLGHARYSGLSQRGLEVVRAAVSNVREILSSSRAEPGTEIPRRELAWVAEGVDLGARIGHARLGTPPPNELVDLPPATRNELSAAALALSEGLTPVWRARSRAAGLAASRTSLEQLAHILGPA